MNGTPKRDINTSGTGSGELDKTAARELAVKFVDGMSITDIKAMLRARGIQSSIYIDADSVNCSGAVERLYVSFLAICRRHSPIIEVICDYASENWSRTLSGVAIDETNMFRAMLITRFAEDLYEVRHSIDGKSSTEPVSADGLMSVLMQRYEKINLKKKNVFSGNNL